MIILDMQNTTSDCSVLVKETAAVLSDDAILQLFLSVQAEPCVSINGICNEKVTVFSISYGETYC
jgi:hypothetical protein